MSMEQSDLKACKWVVTIRWRKRRKKPRTAECIMCVIASDAAHLSSATVKTEEEKRYKRACWSSPAYREQQHLLSQPDKESIMEAIHLPEEGSQMK